MDDGVAPGLQDWPPGATTGCTNDLKLVKKNKIDMKYGCDGVNRLFTRPTVPPYHLTTGYTLYVMTMWMTVYHDCILGLSCTLILRYFVGVSK